MNCPVCKRPYTDRFCPSCGFDFDHIIGEKKLFDFTQKQLTRYDSIRDENKKKFLQIVSNLIAQLDYADFKNLSFKNLSVFVRNYEEAFGRLPNWEIRKLDFLPLLKENRPRTAPKKRRQIRPVKVSVRPQKKVTIFELLRDYEPSDPYYDPVYPADHASVSFKRTRRFNKDSIKLVLTIAGLSGLAVACFVIPFVS